MCFVGIDVSKARVDCAIHPGHLHWSFPRDPVGLAHLTDRLIEHHPMLVVLEATGGLERAVVEVLAAKGIPFAVVNPRHARDFAKATGQLAKTDRLDARVLAWFAQAVRPAPQVLPSTAQQVIAALQTRRRQLVALLISEKNHIGSLPAVIPGDISAAAAGNLDGLAKAIREIDAKLAHELAADPTWSERVRLLRSIPGIGQVTTNALMAGLPELGTLNRKKVAALTGLAPLNRDSGQLRGRRTTWGGRADVRTALYMSTLAAIRCNPTFKAKYDRLVGAGKPKMVAITACMRSLVTLANAVLKTGTSFKAGGHRP